MKAEICRIVKIAEKFFVQSPVKAFQERKESGLNSRKTEGRRQTAVENIARLQKKNNG